MGAIEKSFSFLKLKKKLNKLSLVSLIQLVWVLY